MRAKTPFARIPDWDTHHLASIFFPNLLRVRSDGVNSTYAKSRLGRSANSAASAAGTSIHRLNIGRMRALMSAPSR